MMWRSGPTSHQGGRIGLLHDLWGGWLEVVPTHLHSRVRRRRAAEGPGEGCGLEPWRGARPPPRGALDSGFLMGTMAVGFQAISWRA